MLLQSFNFQLFVRQNTILKIMNWNKNFKNQLIPYEINENGRISYRIVSAS
jgi:hypothetical protein